MKGVKNKKDPETYLYSVVPAAAFRLTGTPNRGGRGKTKTGPKWAGEVEENGKVCSSLSHWFFHTKKKKKSAGVPKLEREWLCSSVILCRFPLCV